MDRKIIFAGILLAAAALSPAPINDARVKRPHVAPRSQAEVEKEQQFNGVTPVVGQVPKYTNEIGEESSKLHVMRSSEESTNDITQGSQRSDRVAAMEVQDASKRVQAEASGSGPSWLVGVMIAIVGYLGWKAVQYKLEKSFPVPEGVRTAPKH